MTAVALSAIRSRAALRANETVGTSTRNTTSAVNDMINESLQAYYLMLTDAGHPQRVTRTTATTSASTALSNGWPANEYVALPSDFLALLSIATVLDSGEELPMEPFSESEYSEFIGSIQTTGYTGPPIKYRIAENTNGLKIARLWPRADAVYTIKIVYIPTPAALSADGDTFNFFMGGAEWVVCDVALKILANNNLPEQMPAIERLQAKAQDTLLRHARRQNRAGTLTMRDTRSRNLRNHFANRWR